MTSSNGNIFRVTDPLCGEFTGPVEFHTQRPVTRSFDVFFDLRLNKRLSKQPWGRWFETRSWSLWRYCNCKCNKHRQQKTLCIWWPVPQPCISRIRKKKTCLCKVWWNLWGVDAGKLHWCRPRRPNVLGFSSVTIENSSPWSWHEHSNWNRRALIDFIRSPQRKEIHPSCADDCIASNYDLISFVLDD